MTFSSKMSTLKPRSASSCAAVMPPMPPPSTTTLLLIGYPFHPGLVPHWLDEPLCRLVPERRVFAEPRLVELRDGLPVAVDLLLQAAGVMGRLLEHDHRVFPKRRG